LKFLFHHLWDEETQKMISFWKFYKMQKAQVN
jgi:hypothetical protein